MKKAVRLPLIEARKRQRWSQQELADHIGTTRINISRWEQGQTTPGPYFRAKLCELFGMSAQDLGLFGEQPREEPQEASPFSLAQVSHPDPEQDEPLWHVPYPRNPFFTGREETLQNLHETLHQQRSLILSQSLAISGLGGIGKTQIALEYAYRYRQEYRFIFWASAATHEALLTDYMAIADYLQLPERLDQDQQKILKAVKRWFTTHCEWLLILDNAEELAIVQDVVPTEYSGHLLLTSRAQALGSLAQRVEVEKMGMAEATLFLLHRAKLLATGAFLDQAAEEHLAAAEAIAIEMDFLPLALDQAGAYIEEIGCSPADYLELFRTHRRELLRRRGHVPTTYPESVATTWSLSFQQLEQSNPAAVELLRLCAYLSPDRIPEELLTEGVVYWPVVLREAASDPFKFNQMLEDLLKFSLVRRLVQDQSLSIHRLVQAVQMESIEPQEQRQWAERVVHAVSKVFPSGESAAIWPQCQRFLSQAQVCVELITQQDMYFAEAGHLLNNAGTYLREQGLYTLAEALLRQAQRIREHILGTMHPDVAQTLEDIAWLYRAQGRYREAEPLLQQAISIYEQQLGQDHPETANSLNNLATVYRELGRYDRAEQLFQRALDIRTQCFGSQHPDVAENLNNLALFYWHQGRYQEAEPLLLKALAIYEQQSMQFYPPAADTLNNLALVYRDLGRYQEAEPLYLRALEIREQQLGSFHASTATSLNNLGKFYSERGRYQEAEQLLLRAQTIFEQQLGPEHPLATYVLNNLALLYLKQGQYEQAEPLLQRAIRLRERALGSEHPQVTYLLNSLAEVYTKQGRYAQAESLFLRALHIWEQAKASDHPDASQSLQGLAELYIDRREYIKAEQLLQRVRDLRETKLGSHHPNTAETLYCFATLREAQGNLQEAASLYQRALAIREDALGQCHPKTEEIRMQYLALLQAMGREEMNSFPPQQR